MCDDIILSNGKDTIIFNQHSYCELVKWLIVKYVGIPYQEANACVEQHIPFFESIDDLLSASLESHDQPYYYTAMRMYFGDSCVKTVQPPPDTPEGLALYQSIEADILQKHDLKEPFL